MWLEPEPPFSSADWAATPNAGPPSWSAGPIAPEVNVEASLLLPRVVSMSSTEEPRRLGGKGSVRVWGVQDSGVLKSQFSGMRWSGGKDSACQCQSCRFNPWVGKIPWRRAWQHALTFLLGKFHGRRSLAGYSPWGHKELDATKHAHTHAHLDIRGVCVCVPGEEGDRI